MQVIITKKHCEGTVFDSCSDCALARAIKEQYPSINTRIGFGVGGSYVRINDAFYPFNCLYPLGWCSSPFRDLEDGRIDKYVLEIPYPEFDNKQVQPEEPKVKEVIRYVSVPESIKELELIQN